MYIAELAKQEEKLENLRITLATDLKFHPVTLFDQIDEGHKDYLVADDIMQLMFDLGLSASEATAEVA